MEIGGLGERNDEVCGVYSPEPPSEISCFTLNFRIIEIDVFLDLLTAIDS